LPPSECSHCPEMIFSQCCSGLGMQRHSWADFAQSTPARTAATALSGHSPAHCKSPPYSIIASDSVGFPSSFPLGCTHGFLLAARFRSPIGHPQTMGGDYPSVGRSRVKTSQKFPTGVPGCPTAGSRIYPLGFPLVLLPEFRISLQYYCLA
jgi:hypothetical protein